MKREVNVMFPWQYFQYCFIVFDGEILVSEVVF